jgi:hypothetical protein
MGLHAELLVTDIFPFCPLSPLLIHFVVKQLEACADEAMLKIIPQTKILVKNNLVFCIFWLFIFLNLKSEVILLISQ